MALGCLVSAAVIGIGLSCVVPDPDYCETRTQCGYADSPMGPMQLFCHPTRHTCLPGGDGLCVKDEDCPVTTPRCDVNTNGCTACVVGDASDTSCARFLDRPLCGVASDGSGATQCLACRTNLDCPNTSPICDNQQCRKCTAHSDCEGVLHCDGNTQCTDSLVCIGDGDLTPELVGRCAQNDATGRVVYVNNLDPICATVTDPSRPLMAPYGSQLATPQCNLQQALQNAHDNTRRYIRVRGQDVPPPTSTIMDGAAYSFIGAPTKNAPMATVKSYGIAFNLLGTGSLTLDELDISEVFASSAVVCSGSATDPVPTLTVRRSILRGGASGANSFAAVAINSCIAVLDGNTIGVTQLADLTNPNVTAHGQGILITDSRHDGATSYLIQNNLIAGNFGMALNLLGIADGAPHFVARFNTIVGNGRDTPNKSGAVFCSPAAAPGQQISHSIIANNSRSSGENSQFYDAGDCGLKDIVVDGNEGLMNTELKHQDPDLDADFHLKTGNSCCLNKVTPGSGETLPAQDILGTSRPQGTAWDIGAFELKQ